MNFDQKLISALSFLGLFLASSYIPQSFAWDVTPTQTSKASPYLSLTTNEQRGRWIYLKNNCAGCHGDAGGGGMGPIIKHAESGDLQEVLAGGENGMPAYKSLTSKDVSMLTAYLASIGKPSEPKFVCWWLSPVKDLAYSGQGLRPNCNP